jgi:uncharacterized protein YndB with AHSA1/START domain
MDEGTILQIGSGHALRFERHLPHPIEKVWAALTDPAQFAQWLASGEIDLRAGGRARLRHADGTSMVDGRVTAAEPPRLIEYHWATQDGDGGPVRWELFEEDGGTRLVFTHMLADPLAYLLALAGWHTILDSLAFWFAGGAPAGRPTWEQLHDGYTRRYAKITRIDDAKVRETANGIEVRFERYLNHPVEKVWAALTDPTRLAEWLAPGEVELCAGGRIHLRFENTGDALDGEILAVAAPTLLEYTWHGAGEGSVRWELSEYAIGTRLVLTHTLPSSAPRESYLAGWHTHLELLGSTLEGRPLPWPWERWQELRDYYLGLAAPR